MPAAVRRAWTEAEVKALGVTTDVTTAGSILGIGRTRSHELARAGEFPVPVIRTGTRYAVPVRPLLAALHLDEDTDTQATPNEAA